MVFTSLLNICCLSFVFFFVLAAPRLTVFHLYFDWHVRAFGLRSIQHLLHPLDHRLLKPSSGLLSVFLIALDYDLIVHREDGHRPSALSTPLVEESQGQLKTVCSCTLYRAVEPLGELGDASAAPASESPSLRITVLLELPVLPVVPGLNAGIGLEEALPVEV